MLWVVRAELTFDTVLAHAIVNPVSVIRCAVRDLDPLRRRVALVSVDQQPGDVGSPSADHQVVMIMLHAVDLDRGGSVHPAEREVTMDVDVTHRQREHCRVRMIGKRLPDRGCI